VLESFVVAMLLRFDAQVPPRFWDRFWPFVAISVVVIVALLFKNGAYRNVLRYTGVYQGVRVAVAAAVAMSVLLVVDLVMIAPFWGRIAPRSVVVIGSVFALVQLLAVRLYPRIFYERSLREVDRDRKRALIVGTGEEGVALATRLWRTPDAQIKPVGFVDHTGGRMRGGQIEGVPVLGEIGEIGRLVEEGYRVVVNEEASKKARARTEVAEFRQWIRGMEEE